MFFTIVIEDKEYTLPMEAMWTQRVILPNKRYFLIEEWDGYPPRPSKIRNFRHFGYDRTVEQLAIELDAVIATEV